jgi:hypothetical protein
VSPNPRQGGTAPITARRSAAAPPTVVGRRARSPHGTVVPSLVDVPAALSGRLAVVGGAPAYRRAVPTLVRTARYPCAAPLPWCNKTAVPSYPRRTARLLTGRLAVVGGARLHTAVPSCISCGRPGTPRRPFVGGAPRPPCRPIPSGGAGLLPGRRPVAGGGSETAVPPHPRRAARLLPGCAASWWRGPETAVSPCPRGTVLTGRAASGRRGSETAVSSCPRGPARRPVRRAVPCGRLGSDRRVALGGGRRATRPELPGRPDPWATGPGPPCRPTSRGGTA